MALPPAFVSSLQAALGPEAADLLAALQGQGHWRGLRLHRLGAEAGGQAGAPLAVAAPRLPVPADLAPALGPPVPWAPDGRYIAADSALGRQVYHEAGAYYLQEPSAMAAAVALDVRPGERICDLCAAPGGKAAAIGLALAGTGQLVANDIHPARARILARNLERLGVPALVTCAAPALLAERWPGAFDAVLVDAPCSGEGMFRRDPEAVAQWRPQAPEACAARQRTILAAAAALTRPGGRILYSTCTFNATENEGVVAWAAGALPVEPLALPPLPGWSAGRPEWGGDRPALAGARRLWPHLARGEGHFLAGLLVTAGPPPLARAPVRPAAGPPGWASWLAELIGGEPPAAWASPLAWGPELFADASDGLPLAGLGVIRPGLGLAAVQGRRSLPHHALAMALSPGRARQALALDGATARAQLAGQALGRPAGVPAGLLWLHRDGLPLGWGRAVPGRINNLYPRGLRRGDLLPECR